MSKDITKIEKAGDVFALLTQTLDGLVATLAGIASSENKDWALSIGYILQRARGGHFLKALITEMRKYREKGEIKDDYFQTEQGLNCLQEILDFIDKDSPDDVRFSAMKAAFLNIAKEKNSNREDALPVQIMKICRSLSSAEILILAASYKMLESDNIPEQVRLNMASTDSDGTTQLWVGYVAKETGLCFPELVKTSERQLMEKNLLAPSIYNDGSGFRKTEFYRLTSLGHHVCTFIGDYAPKD
ncbi:MAG: hypothetical protein ABSH11_13980 [Verrucomicrobiota bacterium]